MRVADDGVGLPTGFALGRQRQTGLKNLARRLEQLYGKAARLAVTARPGGGTLVEIVIPATPTMHLDRATA